MAKSISCRLECYTSWGLRCANQKYDSISKARKEGLWMRDNGFCFSFRIFRTTKRTNQKS